MTYAKTLTVSNEKTELFNNIMNNSDPSVYAIEEPIAILAADFEDGNKIIISLAGVDNDIWVEAKLMDGDIVLAEMAPQMELYDTFVIYNDGDTYELTVTPDAE